jgi:hypothetical protein
MPSSPNQPERLIGSQGDEIVGHAEITQQACEQKRPRGRIGAAPQGHPHRAAIEHRNGPKQRCQLGEQDDAPAQIVVEDRRFEERGKHETGECR